MILEQLTIHGVSSAFRAATAVLDFRPLGPGVYAFCGPNGAGKTTAMECCGPAAIYREFASYGYPFSRHVAPGVRDAFLELVLRLNGPERGRIRLRVQSDPQFSGGRGKTEHYLDVERDTGWQAIAGPALRDTDAMLADLFPTRELFLAGPYAAQRGAGSFFTIEKTEKKALFVELLGHGRLQLLFAQAHKQAQAIGVELEATGARAERLRSLVAQRAGIAAALAIARESMVERTEALQALDVEVGAARQVLERARGALTEHDATTRERVARWQELTKERDRRHQAVRAAEQAHVAAQKAAQAGVTVKVPDLASTRAELAAAEAGLKQIRAHHESLAAGVADQTRRIAELELEQRRHEEDITRADRAAQLEGVDLSLAICQRCPLTERAREAAAERNELLATRPAPNLTREHEELERVRRALQDADAELECAECSAAVLREEQQAAYDLAELDRRSQAARATYEQRRAELDAARALRDEALAALDAAPQPAPPAARETLLHTAELAHEALATLEQRARLLEGARQEAAHAAARLEGELAGVEKQIAGADVDQVEAELGRLQQRRRAWSLLEVGLGPDGIQALEIDAAGPDVSAIANELLAECYGPRFQLRLETTRPLKTKAGQAEVFECAVIDAEADSTAHAGSGGEMVIVEEALRLALAIYATQQSGKELRTLFRDEAAGALDQWPGRDNAGRYLAMLRAARTRGGFHHVFYIAHQPALFEAADGRFVFEGAGRVRFEEG